MARYRDTALERTPVRSVLCFRLFGEGRPLAALNFTARRPGAFTDDSIEMGLIFASHLTLAWNTINREQHFQSALASRDIIGQAKGMLMERFDIDAVAAFDLLARLSQQTNSSSLRWPSNWSTSNIRAPKAVERGQRIRALVGS